ncbi:MAG: hypothetical protein P4L33_01300 [Capsulimonadaceae bacterium]|nr:hypothetical protein [Capsulimonadaceae bacterium]
MNTNSGDWRTPVVEQLCELIDGMMDRPELYFGLSTRESIRESLDGLEAACLPVKNEDCLKRFLDAAYVRLDKLVELGSAALTSHDVAREIVVAYMENTARDVFQCAVAVKDQHNRGGEPAGEMLNRALSYVHFSDLAEQVRRFRQDS